MKVQEIILYVSILGLCVALAQVFMRRGEEDVGPVPKDLELDENPWRFLPGVFRSIYPLLKAMETSSLATTLMPPGNTRSSAIAQRIVVGNLYPLTPQQVACAQLLYGVVLALFALLFAWALNAAANWVLVAGMVGFFMGWVLPSTAVEKAADNRQTEMVRNLPFAIDLIGAAMRSGSSFGDAIRFYVLQGGGGVLPDEFARLMKQVQLGVSHPAALEEMARRSGSKDFMGFANAVAHSLETGAALVETLEIQGAEMRRVRFNIAERKAARAPSLMILPVALFIMPAVFIMIIVPVYLRVQATGMGSMMGGQ